MVRRLIGCLLGVGLVLVAAVAAGQSAAQSGVDLDSPEMTEAEMTRAEVEAIIVKRK